MSYELEDVKGLGKKAENLREAGIDTVEKLANTNAEKLIDIKGIGKASAQKIINSAKELLEESGTKGKEEDRKRRNP
jgi:DNA-directed RNA polymerase alpha subunit